MLNSKNLCSILLALLILLVSQLAYSATLENCDLVSKRTNARMPMQIDSTTMAKSTFCTQSGGKKPVLHYVMSTTLNNLDKSSMKSFQRNFWCSDPGQKELLSFFDIQYEYRTISGVLIGTSDLLSISMCR